MANYLPQSQWEFPNVLLLTTQQSAAEINERYQKVANCAEFLRVQAISIRNAATLLLAEIDAALANFTSQQTTFNALATDAGNKVTTANGLQLAASLGITRLSTANAAVTAARTKLNTAESNANGVLANGMIRGSANLDGIAAAPPANPGILGINSTGIWTWYSAPSGAPFIIEYQVFSTQYSSTTNGGAVTANAWNLVDINTASYGNFKNSIGFPQNVVEETNDRLKLQAYLHYWQIVVLGSNTDAMRARFLLDGVAMGRSLSTQMAAESNSNTLRHFNQDSILDMTVTPAIETAYLQFQTYHNSVNPAIVSAGKGLSGNKGISNVYMTGYGWRMRNIE